MELAELKEILGTESGLTPMEFCGSGAFGEVFRALDDGGGTVALKVIDKEKLGSNWEREMRGLQVYHQKTRQLHPNLITIFHIVNRKSFFFYTMEAANPVSGENGKADSLEFRLRCGRLSYEEIVSYSRQLIDGIESIHRSNLVHRDIKPGNILFVGDHIKIGDIGLVADSDNTVSVAGTPGFMPPETIDRMDASHDLYSLGKVIYCMLSGYGSKVFPLLPSGITKQPELRKLNAFVSQACSNSVDERFRTIDEFRLAFNKAVRPHWLFRKSTWKHGVVSVLAVTVILSLALGLSRNYAGQDNSGGTFLASVPGSRLLFADSMQNKLSGKMISTTFPGGALLSSRGIHMPEMGEQDELRFLQLDLTDIALKNDFEIILRIDGNIPEAECSMFFYAAPEKNRGLNAGRDRNRDILLLKSSLSGGELQLESVQKNGELLFSAPAGSPEAGHRAFRQEIRILKRNNEIVCYANSGQILKVPYELSVPEGQYCYFAFQTTSESSGEMILSQLTVYEY